MATTTDLTRLLNERLRWGDPATGLEVRIRSLRAAGLIPTARAVDPNKPVGDLDAHHCANMILGLISCSAAQDVLAATEMVRALKLSDGPDASTFGSWHWRRKTLGAFLAEVIESQRYPGDHALGEYRIKDIQIGTDETSPVAVVSVMMLGFLGDAELKDVAPAGYRLVYGEPDTDRSDAVWVDNIRKIDGNVIDMMVALLGPVEADAA